MPVTKLGSYKLSPLQRERMAGMRARWKAAEQRKGAHILKVVDRNMRASGVLPGGLDTARLNRAPTVQPKLHITVPGPITTGTNLQPLPAPLPEGMVRRLIVEMGTAPTGGTLAVRFYTMTADGAGLTLGTVTLGNGSGKAVVRLPGAGVYVKGGTRVYLDATNAAATPGAHMTATVEVTAKTATGNRAAR